MPGDERSNLRTGRPQRLVQPTATRQQGHLTSWRAGEALSTAMRVPGGGAWCSALEWYRVCRRLVACVVQRRVNGAEGCVRARFHRVGNGRVCRQLVRLVPNNAGFAFSGGHGAMAADAF